LTIQQNRVDTTLKTVQRIITSVGILFVVAYT